MNESAKDYLGMSDEDFLNINAPEGATAEGAEEETSAADQQGGENPPASASGEQTEENANNQEDGEKSEKTGDDDAQNGATEGDDGNGDEGNKDTSSQDVGDKSGSAAPDAGTQGQPGSKTEQKPGEKTPAADPAAASGNKPDGDKKDEPAKNVDFEAFYKQIIETPFKANGREIKIKSADEAIRLMQMGAGFGRKIQDLQPHLKVLRMLEKNDLLDEGKLSLLIDVNQKNPEAIKKIIKDAGIDPLDLNIGDNVDYRPNNHSVSDKEMALHSALEDIQSAPTGKETLQIINQTWDQQSKSLLWESPELLGVIQTQRENGIYAQIAAEIDRQKLLGQIPANTPFLKAYQLAGNTLFPAAAAAGQAPQIQTQPQQQQTAEQPQAIATRTGQPKSQVKNSDKAAAASPTKTAPRKAATTVNPLAMADDDFLKQFEGRL